MMSSAWNPWGIAAIGLGLVMTIALIIGIGVASWSGKEAAGGAIVDGGEGTGKGAVKFDERYRAAYADCMRPRGYAS